MNPPTADQLDHLIGHTDHRPLTADEHAALREGVEALRRHKEAAEDALTRVLRLADVQALRISANQIHDAIGTSPTQLVARWCLRDELEQAEQIGLAAAARAEQAEARITAVRALHQPREFVESWTCTECSRTGHVAPTWPCPTIRALCAVPAQAQP